MSGIRYFNDIRLVQTGVPLLVSTDAGMMDRYSAEQMKPEQAPERSRHSAVRILHIWGPIDRIALFDRAVNAAASTDG